MPTFTIAPYLPDCRPLQSPKVFCGRLARPPILGRLVTELLPIFQALQARPLDRRNMREPSSG
jgi:hypothetical protein